MKTAVWLIIAGACQAALGITLARAATCREAISVAEASENIPGGLLGAIGQVESGRADSVTGEIAPWPWTADFDGEGRFFATKAEAIEAVRAAQANGMRSIDVGCLQVNLLQHPDAFASLDQAFDPVANANFGALFLRELHDQTRSWPLATAAYHSQTPALGAAYEAMVMRAWPDQRLDGTGGGPEALLAAATVSARTLLPFRVMPGLIRMGAAAPPMGRAVRLASAIGAAPSAPEGRDLAAYRRFPAERSSHPAL